MSGCGAAVEVVALERERGADEMHAVRGDGVRKTMWTKAVCVEGATSQDRGL